MAQRKTGDKKGTGKESRAVSRELNLPNVQADNDSITIGEINIPGNVTGTITISHTVLQPADARLRHDLGILLKNLKTTWIRGMLEKSVHEAGLLELGLELHAVPSKDHDVNIAVDDGQNMACCSKISYEDL